MDEYDGLNDQRGAVLVDRIRGDGVYVLSPGISGEADWFPDTADGGRRTAGAGPRLTPSDSRRNSESTGKRIIEPSATSHDGVTP